MPRFVTILFAVALVALAGCERHEATTHTKKSTMTLQQMEQMFANMRVQTKWDVDGEMLWG